MLTKDYDLLKAAHEKIIVGEEALERADELGGKIDDIVQVVEETKKENQRIAFSGISLPFSVIYSENEHFQEIGSAYKNMLSEKIAKEKTTNIISWIMVFALAIALYAIFWHFQGNTKIFSIILVSVLEIAGYSLILALVRWPIVIGIRNLISGKVIARHYDEIIAAQNAAKERIVQSCENYEGLVDEYIKVVAKFKEIYAELKEKDLLPESLFNSKATSELIYQSKNFDDIQACVGAYLNGMATQDESSDCDGFGQATVDELDLKIKAYTDLEIKLALARLKDLLTTETAETAKTAANCHMMDENADDDFDE